MNKIEIYTDGSCLGNPGPGGWGVIILNGGQQKPASGGHSHDHAHDSLSGGEPQTTNNRMEMTAIIKALEWVHKNLGGKPTHTTAKPATVTGKSTGALKKNAIIKAPKNEPSNLNNYNITIYSDSNLIVQTLNQGWKRKANTDLWAQIDKLRAWLNINFVWVKAHHTNGYNNQVDKLAFDAARHAATCLPAGSQKPRRRRD